MNDLKFIIGSIASLLAILIISITVYNLNDLKADTEVQKAMIAKGYSPQEISCAYSGGNNCIVAAIKN